MTAAPDLRLAVFDCDGTLVDSQHSIIAAMDEAWRVHGLGAPDARAVRRIVGLPLEIGIARLLPEGDEEDFERLSRHYRAAAYELRQNQEYEEPLYPGAIEAIEALAAAGYLLGVATGKSRRGLDATLESHRLTGRFATLQTGDAAPGKPAPDMLLRAMAETGAGPGKTAMIGDTSFDMLMAKSAGAVAIGVSWGYHGEDELRECGAARVLADFGELPAALDALIGER
ncbi:MAG: HAD-IA family hydrolase [Proteobacteria bacterium]|nr:HAD-IA family hydrolase [Pseudomonadota bacterium]